MVAILPGATSPRARRALKITTGVVALLLLIHLAIRLVDFANLFGFFRGHSGITITQREILDAYASLQPGSDNVTASPAVVPKILHQVYHDWDDPLSENPTLPDDWEAARQTCIALNPDWEYHLWSSKSSRDFIEDEFPWFLSTYDGYKFPVQRVDVIRYFALLHFGGIYIDLDNGCSESLDVLTYYPAFTTDGGHGTLSNNIIGGQPGHPFFHLLTESLVPWNWNWILPYVIVSYTSGQWFVTAMWEKYHRLLSADGTVRGFDGTGWAPLHHILMDMRPGAPDPYVLWTQERGGTWDQWDSAWFGWLGNHVGLVIAEVVGTVVVTGLVLWGSVRLCCYCRRRSKGTRGYALIKEQDPV
ncbi:nucleotide-diphospho-sugar transferase [Biscogniauxia sp. FL1348]|nr:nucleotide-diphospho-sugar transferase [Biscogniauxia sp. FL1348]